MVTGQSETEKVHYDIHLYYETEFTTIKKSTTALVTTSLSAILCEHTILVQKYNSIPMNQFMTCLSCTDWAKSFISSFAL